MQLNIQSFGFRLSEAIVAHAEERINAMLGSAKDRIDSVTLRLSDINSNRGGEDMQCRIVVRLRDLHTVVVEAVSSDLYASIDEAAGRIKESVWRHLKRQRTLRREFGNRRIRQMLI